MNHRMMTGVRPNLGGLLLLSCLVLIGSVIVDSRVSQPYMDEVFHVPQAQAFCEGRWAHWDDKITTLP